MRAGLFGSAERHTQGVPMRRILRQLVGCSHRVVCLWAYWPRCAGFSVSLFRARFAISLVLLKTVSAISRDAQLLLFLCVSTVCEKKKSSNKGSSVSTVSTASAVSFCFYCL